MNANTHARQTIVIEYEVSFLITSIAGNRITCKTAFSVGMEADHVIRNGTWYLADFSTESVSSHCAVTSAGRRYRGVQDSYCRHKYHCSGRLQVTVLLSCFAKFSQQRIVLDVRAKIH